MKKVTVAIRDSVEVELVECALCHTDGAQPYADSIQCSWCNTVVTGRDQYQAAMNWNKLMGRTQEVDGTQKGEG
jgi:hypothetical protein